MSAAARRPLQGTFQVLRLNWSQYAAGLLALGAAGTLATTLAAHPLVRVGAWVVAGVTGWLLVASVVASWWVYDRAGLYDWHWLVGALPSAPGRWAVLHAGFDEAGPGLRALLAEPPAAVLDIGAELPRWTASLRRARGRVRGPRDQGAWVDALPLAGAGVDTAFVIFAAHELRRRVDRDALFAELARVLAPGGTVVLVEHARDLANALVFGPGALHFLPRREWLRVSAGAGLAPLAELHLTPFVRGWLLCRR